MPFLGGFFRSLRNDADQIGSFFTGQPAHGSTPAPPPPPQAPRLPALQVRAPQNPQMFVPPSSPAMPRPPQLPVNIAHPGLLSNGTQTPGTGVAGRPDNTLQINQLLHPNLLSQVRQGLHQKLIPAEAAVSELHDLGQQFIARPAAELATSLQPRQSTFTPRGNFNKFVFGSTPIQNIEKKTVNNYQTHPNLPTPLRYGLSGLEAAGSLATDLPVAGGVAKGAERLGRETATLVPQGAVALQDGTRSLLRSARSQAVRAAAQGKPVRVMPLEKLTRTDNTGYGELDPQRVAFYRQQIRSGQPIEPIFVMKDDKGQHFIEDGKNRTAAYEAEGVKNIPAKVVTPEDIKKIAEGGFVRLSGASDSEPTGISKPNEPSGGMPASEPSRQASSKPSVPEPSKPAVVPEGQGQTVYHGTDKASYDNITGKGIVPGTKKEINLGKVMMSKSDVVRKFGNEHGFSVSRNPEVAKGYGEHVVPLYIDPSAKIATAKDFPEVFKQFEDGKYFNMKDAIELAKNNGYDGIDVHSFEVKTPKPSKNEEIQIFNTKVLKTKDQLAPQPTQAGKAIEPNVAETLQGFQSKGGPIMKEGPVQNGRQDVIRIKPNPETGHLEAHQESVVAPNAAQQEVEEYAKTFGITKMQAEKDLREMSDKAMERKQLSEEDLKALSPQEQLSVRQRRELIAKDPRQQTINQIDLNPTEGSPKSAIANAMAVSQERDARLSEAVKLGEQLDEHDKALLDRYDAGESIDKLSNNAHDPEAFSAAAHSIADALDYSLAADRTAGAATLRQHNYIPHNYEVSEEWLDKHKIPDDQRIRIGDKVRGFRDIHAKYGSYKEAAKAGLKPLFNNRIEDVADYAQGGAMRTRNNLLQAALAKALPDDIAPIDTTYLGGKRFMPAANGNLPFAASEELNKSLKGFQKAWSPDSTAGKLAEGAVRLTGKATKKSLFSLSYFHQAHIAENVTFATAMGGQPRALAEGIINEVKATGGISKTTYFKFMDAAREDGSLDYGRRMGIQFEGNSQLGRFVDIQAVTLARAAQRGGIEAGSQEAVDLGTIYNRLLGRDNPFVEARNPTIEKMTSYFALAPHYLRTQLRLVWDALAPQKFGGAGYDRATSMLTPGGAARSAVLGPRVFGALTAITASAIIMHRFPTLREALNEAGLNPNNMNPNIEIKSKNNKGETQVLNLPTDPIGLALGFLLDPKHFFQSRYSPVISFGAKVATNTNWNGQPLSDSNSPNALRDRVLHAAENSFLPIGLQNFTNFQHNVNNPNVEQGIAQEFGLRLKTNPNDPQVQANKKYFDTYTQVQSGLKKTGQYGQYWSQVFDSLHPKNTTDASGAKYPTPYDPVSSEKKYDAYTYTDPKTAKRVLSPVFYADQKLNNTTPNYPASPLYKLSGYGKTVEGGVQPKALVALEYQHAQDPAAKQVIMNANGGQNGWLSKYEQQLGDYAQHYQDNMNKYFQSLGWTSKAIDDYWAKHPSTPDPIDQVNFDKPTQNLIDQYEQLSASGDSTGASKFFSQHNDVLGPAFDMMAQHANALHQAKGELQMQGYPQESDHIKAIFSQMPQGSDKASKKARAVLIDNNPDVKQYLADMSLYETLSKGAQFRFKNPTNMNATEGQNIMNGGSAGQSFLKNARNLGVYDIGYDPLAAANQQYSLMQNGTFPGGANSPYSTAGGSGSYHKKKAPYFHMRRPKKIRIHYASHMRKVHLAKPPSPVKIKNKANKHVGIKSKTYL